MVADTRTHACTDTKIETKSMSPRFGPSAIGVNKRLQFACELLYADDSTINAAIGKEVKEMFKVMEKFNGEEKFMCQHPTILNKAILCMSI